MRCVSTTVDITGISAAFAHCAFHRTLISAGDGFVAAVLVSLSTLMRLPTLFLSSSLGLRNFKAFVDAEPIALVAFFQPMDGTWRHYTPDYERAAATLKKKNIPLAKVNCVEEGTLCRRLGYETWDLPSWKVYKNGKPVKYSQYVSKEESAIVNYMLKQTLPPVVPLLTAHAHSEFTRPSHTAAEIVAVAYLLPNSESSSPLNTAFSALAHAKYHDTRYAFGASADLGVAAAAGVVPPAVVLYRPFDAPRVAYPGALASCHEGHKPRFSARKAQKVLERALRKWIAGLSVPIFAELRWDNSRIYLQKAEAQRSRSPCSFADPAKPAHWAGEAARGPPAAGMERLRTGWTLRGSMLRCQLARRWRRVRGMGKGTPLFMITNPRERDERPVVLDTADGGVTPEGVRELVKKYLEENPALPGGWDAEEEEGRFAFVEEDLGAIAGNIRAALRWFILFFA
ncbi:hypothetical protein DFP72DRAFT_865610 [Ephemerocybe angulata]|uniref:protein disulfide-isomerase n=1 Tax=Ephemerocybe angulata TaxID=980116 RepID=A0A8H6MHS8_9AGAR|nr:hypothetical protein DFP72DRAFT_865610 [Tulosesus angulatus]